MVASERMPHALLFVGAEGVGRQAAAQLLAMRLNCLKPPEKDRLRPCGQCRACHKIQNGHHPDVHRLAPTGATIRIQQVRELIQQLSKKAYEGRWQVATIHPAEALPPQAANAILKTLEEPPPATLLILMAQRTSDLLPTVLSRCQQVRFAPIATERLVQWLEENRGLSPEAARPAAVLAAGSLKRVEQLTDPQFQALQRWLTGFLATIEEAPPIRLLAMAEWLSNRKETLADMLAIMRSWYRDRLVGAHAPDLIANDDLTAKTGYDSTKASMEALLAKLSAIVDAERDLQQGSFNMRLVMETLLLQLASR